jgi:hypothetical protein
MNTMKNGIVSSSCHRFIVSIVHEALSRSAFSGRGSFQDTTWSVIKRRQTIDDLVALES